MQTTFTLAQLADPQTYASEKILRACVHCGFCTATCPTYVLLGDELDSPRGRIYLIKEMLEQDRPATAEVVKHVDRCLSCLSCMTTCPVRRELHASGRSRPRAYREDLQAPAVRSRCARDAGARAHRSGAVPAGGGGGADHQAACAGARPLGLHRLAAMLRLSPHHKLAPPSERTGKVHPAEGNKLRPGRVAVGLHRSGAGALDQRGRDPHAQPPWHRGRGGQGRGLLRFARPSHGPRSRSLGERAQQYRRLDRRDRRRRVSTPF